LLKTRLAGTLVALFGSASNESNDFLQAPNDPIKRMNVNILIIFFIINIL
jgi:hypothetical protein